MTIAIYDTYCGSLNSGDAIIMDAITEQLNLLFPHEHKVRYPTHYPLSGKAIRRIKKSSMIFVGGTNLLSSNIFLRGKKNQWAIGQIGAMMLKEHAILFGCGWKNYQEPSSKIARLFYKTILSSRYIHSVRDSYTEKKIRELGIDNVVNTGCPTLWKLTPAHCASIPTDKADRVVFTITDYRRNPAADSQMIMTLLSLYDKVHFWMQGSNDLTYLNTLVGRAELNKIELVGPALSEYDALLSSGQTLDYIGTRLHAAIRALQHKHRSIIIGVDNRALEKRSDFNLTVLEREKIETLADLVTSPVHTRLALPIETINSWRRQFNPSIADIA